MTEEQARTAGENYFRRVAKGVDRLQRRKPPPSGTEWGPPLTPSKALAVLAANIAKASDPILEDATDTFRVKQAEQVG
jgi:hypothetical protein